jgi:hypothetical protein
VRTLSSAMASPNCEPRLPRERTGRRSDSAYRSFLSPGPQDPYIVRRSRDGVAAIDCRMTPVRVDAMLVLVDVRKRVRSEVMT